MPIESSPLADDVALPLDAQGRLWLPPLRVRGSASGLSGAHYTVEMDLPSEAVDVSGVALLDPLTVRLTFVDGRALDLLWVSTLERTSRRAPDVPRLTLVVGDDIGTVPPVMLRARLPDLLPQGCWIGHWQQAQLLRQAEESALEQARFWLDWDDGETSTADPARRDRLLQREILAILDRQRTLSTPDGQLLRVTGVALFPLGVASEAPGILVHHDLPRPVLLVSTICGRALDVPASVAGGAAVLEMDLSDHAGFLHRELLAHLVTQSTSAKRWAAGGADLALPLENTASRHPVREALAEDALLQVTDLVKRYLDGIARLDDSAGRADDGHATDAVLEAIRHAAAGLRLHGFPGADNPALYRADDAVLRRLVRLRAAADSQDVAALRNTLEAIIDDAAVEANTWHTVYLMAMKAWKIEPEGELAEAVRYWRDRVRTSIRAQEPYYLRDASFDPLLGTVFPELSLQLDHPFGKRPAAASPAADDAPQRRAKRRALPASTVGADQEADLAWRHPLQIRRDIAKTLRARLILRGEAGPVRQIVEELIDMAEDIAPWQFALAQRAQSGLGKSAVLRLLHEQGLIAPPSAQA
ncbi:hypothetical protein [Noviherbaspirillum galbum]|uniref:Uncharacterized protein n=1 Tax=Noviherbaspirillum galbum TaxID=2709383 RepID=A0A6B3SR75_9BURK|nr:hypothetical protein [Noviherbaspirillum galbum]NEX63430.1 hypothetical protein [Noviherbaspirillum galbum]